MKAQHVILAALITFGIWVAFYVYGPNGVINAPYVPVTITATYKEPSAEQARKAKEAVKLALKDPESAQFRNLRLDIIGEVCGEVNAKNGFGGYTGFKMFQVNKGQAFLEKEPLGLGRDAELINNTNALIAASCGTSHQ